MARWCAAQGASVTVADTRAEPPQLAALRQQLPTARFVSGALDASLLDDASVRAV
ncbi:MAG TPA: UDP-N-acetylmuramoyl-L-alanine--D-glutamate ligase, partial [Ottowia sp.]|nr:UDP-N-acetylmuramoyl-L-alanine--D-glutamate ligase [Ottowia sp.]